jgi:hypothetical protein
MVAAIKYKSGYKYQLVETVTLETSIRPPISIETEWITLTMNGKLTCKKGYAWDGPSGPAFDTKNFMMPSLGHDAIYQLIRLNLLPKAYRIYADKDLRYWCLKKKMSRIRAWWVYWAVRLRGPKDGGKENPVLVA